MPLNIPTVPLSAIVGVHFILVAWASLYPFMQHTYFFTNLFVLLIGLWAIKDKESPEPVQFFLFGKGFTILNDIILLGIYFGPANKRAIAAFQFSAAMAIINLLLKPITCLILFKNWQDRGSTGYDDLQGPPPSSGYGGPPGGYSAPPSGGYMPPPGGYAPPPETKPYRPPQTTYNAPTVGP